MTELLQLSRGPLEVEIVPALGARLHRLRVDGIDLLRTPGDVRTHGDDPWFWGSYPMAPWCNRLPTGLIRVGSTVVDLRSNFADGSAIHGQVSGRAWTAADGGPDWARLTIDGGGDDWPWPYEVEQEVRLGDDRLTIRLRLTNRADEVMPGGVGFHPWFRMPTEVAIRAELVHPSNLETAATPEPVHGALDRRSLGSLAVGIDATWADPADPPVLLAWPEDGIRATMTVDAPTRFIVAAHPADIDAIAVEPQTHAPDGLRRLLVGDPGGLTPIPPGASLTLTMTLAFARFTVVGDVVGQAARVGQT